MQIKNGKNNKKYMNGSKLKAGVVVARWNSEITGGLLKSALIMLKKNNMSAKNIKVISVTGSVEIPFALHRLAQSRKYDFLVALGCVIRGETPHFDYVCKMAQEGILKVMLEDNIPVGFGMLTVDDIAQARMRAHVGGESALAALELSLLK